MAQYRFRFYSCVSRNTQLIYRLADMGLLELTVVRQTHAAMILAMVSVLMFVWLKTRGAEI